MQVDVMMRWICDQLMSFHSISESHFWRNYFYRVSLIKQSYDISAAMAQGMSLIYVQPP